MKTTEIIDKFSIFGFRLKKYQVKKLRIVRNVFD